MREQSGSLLSELVESCLETGVVASFSVDGRSMLPFIRPGDGVILGRPDGAAPRLGDVVAVRGMPGGGLLVHRVVRVRSGRLLLRGDNTSVDNGEHSVDEILAIVSAVERNGRPVWFGAGRWGPVVAVLVRTGWVNRLNRVVFFARRSVGRRSPGESGSA